MKRFRSKIANSQQHENYLAKLSQYHIEGKYEVLLKSLVGSVIRIKEQVKDSRPWEELSKKFSNILANLDRIDSNLVFSFLRET